jgi:amphi-Trp domain-containing protein
MGDSQKVKFLSTIKKDEAAFYLSELAKGLLKNRVNIRVGDRRLVMATFDSIHLEMKALDKDERYAIDIRLSWRKPSLGISVGRTDSHPVLGKREELF